MRPLINQQVLPTSTYQVIRRMQTHRLGILESFYLAGGTGLALWLGHRWSEDLGFFTQKPFDPTKILAQLKQTPYQIDDVQLADNTLNLYLDKVKLQFLYYPYPLLEPLFDWQGVKLSSLIDIACTKLVTISQRGDKKDFVDLYFILSQTSLAEVLAAMERKYQGIKFNRIHILKSLTFFQEADKQPMPRLLKPAKWEDIKDRLIQWVTEF